MNYFGLTRNVLQTEGIRGLYRGIIMSLIFSFDKYNFRTIR